MADVFRLIFPEIMIIRQFQKIKGIIKNKQNACPKTKYYCLKRKIHRKQKKK